MKHNLVELIPSDWRTLLEEEFNKTYWHELEFFLASEFEKETIFPSRDNIFAALKYTPFNKVKVLLLGQDPYHDIGQAHGLCFSVAKGIKLPPSLKNIFKELNDDLSIPVSDNGCLNSWAEQGVLMLNTSLTVRAHQAASHSKIGWTKFSDAVIRKVNEQKSSMIFVLWGAHAAAKEKLIDKKRHIIIKSAHPSPLSAYRGFFGSKPFSKINEILTLKGVPPINWKICEEQENEFRLETEYY